MQKECDKNAYLRLLISHGNLSSITYHNLAAAQGNPAGLGTVAVDILAAEVVLDMHLAVEHTVNFL